MSEELRLKLKAARAKLGITQKGLAATLGIPYQTLLRWEQNTRTPRGLALIALNERLDAILAEK